MDVEVQLFECDSCHLEFKQKSTFLRHVSHKKVCKLYYGDSRLNDMRIEGKLSAKRKWWQRHADKAKKSYRANSLDRKERKRNKYVKEEQRRSTDEGWAFLSFYNFIYQESKDRLLEDLRESGFAHDKVEEKARHAAIDDVFTSNYDFVHFFKKKFFLKGKAGIEFDEDKYSTFEFDAAFDNDTEKAMEAAYKYHLEQETNQLTEKWIESVRLHISMKCRNQGEDSAFNMFFQEFCETLFPTICEKSLDRVFDNLGQNKEEEMSDQQLEEFLKDNYEDCLADEAIRTLLESEIGCKLLDNIDTKISKQIRFMKLHEDTFIHSEFPSGKVIEKIVYLRK